MSGALSNPRWERFCQYYVYGHPGDGTDAGDWRVRTVRNGQRSYEAAGFTSTGNTARTAASRLLRKLAIHERIGKLEEESESR